VADLLAAMSVYDKSSEIIANYPRAIPSALEALMRTLRPIRE